MQITLLGIAIAIILALVAALAGPFVVDWTQYRGAIEAEASRRLGVELRTSGPIEARLLPSPQITLHNIAVGEPSAPRLRARALDAEFALGPLMRGQLRAVEFRVSGPELNLEIDPSGRVVLPKAAAGFDPDELVIDRLHIEDGRAVLIDRISNTTLALDKLWFNGDARSLAGPLQGEGAFSLDGDPYPFRLATGRVNEEGALRLRLNIDPVSRPLAFEGEGMVSLARGEPRFEGTLNVSRLVGLAPGKTLVTLPWRASTKIKANTSTALMEQIEFQYGSDDQAIKLTGTAEFKFGQKPRFDGVLSARQIDLDRALANSDTPRLPPVAALRNLIEAANNVLRPSVPAQLGIGIDQVTLGGANIQTVRGDISTESGSWNLDRFEFRAPGFTQVRLSGRLAVEKSGVTFTGPAAVDAGDLKTLVAWLEGRSESSPVVARPLRARGELTLGGEKIAVERLKAEFDRETIEGRLSYVYAAGDRPPSLEAELNAPELDVDAALAFARTALTGAQMERPRVMTLGIGIGRATLAGVQVSQAEARLRVDTSGLQIDRLAVADLGGAAISVSGRVAMAQPTPRGNFTLDLDARNLAGVTALLAKYAPAFAAPLERIGADSSPSKLRATLNVDAASGGTAGIAKFALEGRAAGVRVNIGGQASGEIAAPQNAEVKLQGKLDSDDGAKLAAALGLASVLAVDNKPGVFSFSASGPTSGEMKIDTKLDVGLLEADAQGALRLFSDRGATGAWQVNMTGADARVLRRAGAATAPLPVAFSGQLALANRRFALEQFSGMIAGSRLRGKLGLTVADPLKLDGEIEADNVNAAILLAAVAGMPGQVGAQGWLRSPDPFSAGAIPDLDGAIAFKSARAAIMPGVEARQFRATLRLQDKELTLDDLVAELAPGKLEGSVTFRRTDPGLNLRGRLALSGIDAPMLLPATTRPPVTGKLNIQAEFEGSGLSPLALIGSLAGSGNAMLENGTFASLDPRAFDVVAKAVDRGLPVDAGRIGDVAGKALDSGQLAVPRAEAALTISAGQVRVDSIAMHGNGADATVSGRLDLADGKIDARLKLSAAADKTAGGRPDIFMTIRGPVSSPARAIDVSALTGWLTLRSIERQSRRLQEIEATPPPPKDERAPALPAPVDIRPRPEARPPAPAIR